MGVGLGVLGPTEVIGPDGAVDLREGVPRKVLAALVMHLPAPVPVEVLIEDLWPERRPKDPRNALQAHISYLRRALAPVAEHVAVERAGDAYRLRCDGPVAVDVVRFEQAVRSVDARFDPGAGPAELEGCLAQLDEALALWRGPAYADLAYDDFAQVEIARLDELRAGAQARRADLLLALGRSEEAAVLLGQLVAEHPLRETLWASLMLALYRSRRQADALRAYAEARSRLVDELGLEPGPELRALEARILAQDPTLDGPAAAPSAPGAARPATSAAPADDTATAADAMVADVAAGPSGPKTAGPATGAVATGTGTGIIASSVPEPVSSLVGRGFEVGHVIELVRANRLTTLTGPGGVGKTRLAVEVARVLRAEWPTRLIELGPLALGGDVALRIASEVGVPAVPGVSPLDAVAARLGPGPSLLVLDTCEHVVEQAAASATALLRGNEAVRILATSRQPLGIGGELVWTVPPLELADPAAASAVEAAASGAVRLFEVRARAARSSFVLDETNAAAVAEICRVLDGLPLAIELAAARVNLLSPAAILARLSDRFTLLTQGDRTAEPRQRSLRALLQWSYELLSEEEQAYFERLSVFAGGFDLEAATALAPDGVTTLAPDGAAALDLLGALVERSLVQSTGADRFVMLDTLRAFAAERLAQRAGPAGTAAVRDAHAAWCARVATAADPRSHGPLPDGWASLRAEDANCLAGLEWLAERDDAEAYAAGARLAGALAGFWLLEGRISTAHRWLNRFRRAAAPDDVLASLWRGIGVLELYQSRFEASLAAAEQAVGHARASGGPELVASTLVTLGSAGWGVGALADSAAALAEAAALFEASGDGRGRGFALARLGRTLAAMGDEAALAHLRRATELLTAAGDLWVGCIAGEHLADALLRFGRAAEAVDAATEALALGERIGSHAGQLSALLTLGRALLDVGDGARAREVHVRALGHARTSGNPGATADALDALAAGLARRDRPDAAARLIGAADARRAASAVTVARPALDAREALVDAVRAAVGPARFDELAADGAGRELDWLLAAGDDDTS